jgi:hypothetical protein
VSLSLQATAAIAALPAWAPGSELESSLDSSANDLGSGASQFIDGLATLDQTTMTAGANRMNSGGSELTAAQGELDALSSVYSDAGC